MNALSGDVLMNNLPKSRDDFPLVTRSEVVSAAIKLMSKIKDTNSHLQAMSLVAAIWVILSETNHNIHNLLSMTEAYHRDYPAMRLTDGLQAFSTPMPHLDAVEVAGHAVKVMDALQKIDPSVQLLALLTVTQRLLVMSGCSIQDLLMQIDELSKDEVHSERIDHRFSALKFYFRRHLKDSL